ncbi:MAG: D-glycerate dehydrogenase [Terriglobia bacterium]|jgi:lactate dehydrogenase-like 2-hydroxyacid dehydrogenase
MSLPKVYITRPLPTKAVERLAARCDVKMRPEDAPLDPAQLAESCRDIEGLMATGVRVSEDVVAQAPRLRAVANVGVGYDNIDVAACTRRGIPVTNTPDVLTETTADLAFALLMAAPRRLVECDRYVREGQWQSSKWELLWGSDIYGKTLGVYGLGRIGKAVVRRARGFSMRVIYFDVVRPTPDLEEELGVQFVDRETLLREADFLTLHVPLTPETHHLIGARELSMLKPTAFLINAARGKCVDEAALVEALQSKRLAGAGLDVFEHEPHVHPGLLSLPNVVLAPHVGSATAQTRLAMAMLAVENLVAGLEGRRPPNLVNPEIYA